MLKKKLGLIWQFVRTTLLKADKTKNNKEMAIKIIKDLNDLFQHKLVIYII